MPLEITADFWRELALLEPESMGWTPLEDAVCMGASDTNATLVLVVGLPQAGAVVLLWGEVV